MSMLEVVPGKLMSSARMDDFLTWLNLYPAPPKIRKEILVDWCKEMDVKLKRWMVVRIGAGKA